MLKEFFTFALMKLSNYISDLLYRYECVIVPDFGGFVTNNKSAIISQYSKIFYPPHKLITYNGHLRNNDGLLANYIAAVDKVPFECAMNFIKFEVDEWRKELRANDLVLEKIGKFILDKNDAIIFEPQTDINYLTTAFGLSSFVSPEIKRETYIKQVETLEEKAPILISDRKKGVSEYLKYAAIFVIGLSIIGFTGNALYKDYKNKQQIVAAKKQQDEVETKIEKATFIISDILPSLNLNVSLEKKSYHVIGGAFRYPENATRLVKTLQAKGYKARILGINQWGLTQVAFDSYDSREEAIQHLYEIRKTESKEAWLLIQEL